MPGDKPNAGGTPAQPGEPGPEDTTNTVVSKYGKIRILKKGITGANTEINLQGAEFDVYRAVDGPVTPHDLDGHPVLTLVHHGRERPRHVQLAAVVDLVQRRRREVEQPDG